MKHLSRSNVKVKCLKLFLIANYALTPCGEVITMVRVILRSNTKVKVISRSNTHISSNNYLCLIKCCICQGQIQLKVKCQGHFKVKYLKLFIITNFAKTPYCEVFIMVKVKCQGHFKVKYLKMFIMNNFAITPYCEAFTKLKVI